MFKIVQLSFFLFTVTVWSEPLLLSGEVAARHSEVFLAPQGEDWLMQIAWMVDEGKRVQPGELVVQYDSANILSQLEQLEAKLRKAQAEGRQTDLTQGLELEEARHALMVAELNLDKAELDANIPQTVLSKLEYEQNQLAYTRAIHAVNEAKQALKIKEKDVAAEKRRSQMEIAGAENELQRMQLMLERTTQKATQAGTAMYVEHPWTREKIRTGESVPRGARVLELPDIDDLRIKAWLNEVDIARITRGQQGSITFDALPGVRARGRIVHIGSQAQAKHYWGDANYIDVEIDIEGDVPVGLLPGMSVLVEVQEGGDMDQ